MDASSERQTRIHRWLALPVFVLICTTILFPLAGRNSAYVVVDSGTYLSMAYNLTSHGELVSSFNYLGNFEHLPAPPSFAPPGLSLLVAALRPFTGSEISAAKLLLFFCLALVQLFAVWIVLRCTGSSLYAMGASIVLLFQGHLLAWSAAILTELPFMAILAGIVLAGIAVLEGSTSRWVRFVGLPVGTALLCLTRFIGVFFPVAFTVLYLAFVLRRRDGLKASVPGALGYLVFYNAVSLAPLILWIGAAGAASTSLLPARPPSQLGLGKALLDATGYLFFWIVPWYVLGFLLWALPLARKEKRLKSGSLGAREGFFAATLLAYLALLIVARTSQAHYPLTELGARYMAPAWLLTFLLGACLLHRILRSVEGRMPRVVTVLLAVVVVWWSSGEIRNLRLAPPYPLETETYQGVLRHVPSDAVILCNYGQPLVIERPEARVIGIASTEDLYYELDLPTLLSRHELEWIILFDNQGREARYPPWFQDWLRGPPSEARVLQTWRFRDGVIYRLDRS